jgi:hypothetical protein
MPISFHDHYNYTDEKRQPLLTQIRSELHEWDNKLIETITAAQRIAYSKPNRKVFLEVKVQRHAIVLHMIDVPDPDHILSKIPESHGWRQLTGRAKIETNDDLKRTLPLIRAAWHRGKPA